MSSSERKKTIRYIVIFIFLVMAVTFVSPLLGGSPGSPGPGFILWGAAPLLVAVLLRLVTRDWSDAGLRPAIRKNVFGYIIVLFAPPVMMMFTLLIGTVTSFSSVSGFSMAPYLKIVLPASVIFFIFAIFEEFGWRGYLVPKLASLGINGYLASAIVAIVWGTWHLPYIRELTWVYGSGDLTTFIPRYYLYLFVLSILFYEIRILTGSVWPAVLLHCLMNSIQHPLDAEYLTIAAGKEYLVSFTGLFIIAFTGLLGIALNRWRMRKAGTAHLSTSLT